jgi:pimeloyl-ACP methyl ester carboxylesterase
MASKKRSRNTSRSLAHSLRGALGLRRPTGSCFINDYEIARYEFFSGPVAAVTQTVVCLHRIGSGSREFRPLIDRTPYGTRLILLDWPGHGRSSSQSVSQSSEQDTSGFTFSVEDGAKLLAETLNQVKISRPILLGSGFGAAVALSYAADRPEELPGLVLCQPDGLMPPRRKASASVPELNPARRQALREQILQPAFVSAASQAEASMNASESSLRQVLRSLSCPILFALSKEDKKYPLQRYLELLDPALAQSPQHRITVFSGGFNPIWDEPDRFAQAFTAFLQAQLPLEKHRHAWLLAAVDWPTRAMNLWKCVHPECPSEQLLPEGQNPNQPAQLGAAWS